MSAVNREPVELIARRLADLPPIPLLDPDFGEGEMPAADFIASCAVRGHFELWLQAPYTGHVEEAEGEVLAGRAAFEFYWDRSLAVFWEDFEPFGRVWQDPEVEQLADRINTLRLGHFLDEDPAVVADIIGPGYADQLFPSHVIYPFYFVTFDGTREDEIVEMVRHAYRDRRDGRNPLDTYTPRPSAPEPEFVGTAAAAKLIGRNPQTLRTWRAEGKGPPWSKPTGPKGHARYPMAELRAWAGKNPPRSS